MARILGCDVSRRLIPKYTKFAPTDDDDDDDDNDYDDSNEEKPG